jgi:hypothetical protein
VSILIRFSLSLSLSLSRCLSLCLSVCLSLCLALSLSLSLSLLLATSLSLAHALFHSFVRSLTPTPLPPHPLPFSSPLFLSLPRASVRAFFCVSHACLFDVCTRARGGTHSYVFFNMTREQDSLCQRSGARIAGTNRRMVLRERLLCICKKTPIRDKDGEDEQVQQDIEEKVPLGFFSC